MDIVVSHQAPAAVGPYSQAVKANGFVFCSGQIPLRTDGEFVEGGITEQTQQVLENLKAVLMEAGSDFARVLKVTTFLTDMKNFPQYNEVYSQFFQTHKPARSTIGVKELPKGALIEIECVALYE